MQSRFLTGILTERDVLRAAASGSDLTNSPVSAWMTMDPEQASPDTTVEDALQLMLLHGFRHLPVLEDREVCGVVSLRDLAASRIIRRVSHG
jgi:CBS domain-containing protein